MAVLFWVFICVCFLKIWNTLIERWAVLRFERAAVSIKQTSEFWEEFERVAACQRCNVTQDVSLRCLCLMSDNYRGKAMQVSSLILQTVWGSFDACIEPLFYWKINLFFCHWFWSCLCKNKSSTSSEFLSSAVSYAAVYTFFFKLLVNSHLYSLHWALHVCESLSSETQTCGPSLW